jgi:hypothetical protein
VEAIVVDAREEMANDFVAPILMANALYEGRYPLVSSISRPLIVRHLVAAARKHGADAVAHGCTGKGNDQVRFDVATRSLAPDLEIVAPVRVWGMNREETIAYAEKHELPITISRDKIYSIDENLWGRSIECGILEDPWAAPPEDVFTLTVPTTSEAVELVVGLEAGGPVRLDGKSILGMPTHERALAGLFLAFQYPLAVSGVSVANFVRTAVNARRTAKNPEDRGVGLGDENQGVRQRAAAPNLSSHPHIHLAPHAVGQGIGQGRGIR